MHLQNALSLSFAASIRVGNELGAGNTQRAKRVFHISLALAGERARHLIRVDLGYFISTTVCEALVLAVGLQALKYQLGAMFTYDE